MRPTSTTDESKEIGNYTIQHFPELRVYLPRYKGRPIEKINEGVRETHYSSSLDPLYYVTTEKEAMRLIDLHKKQQISKTKIV